MRIAFVSDIHGNLLALQAVLDDLKRRGGADLIINLGDIVSGPLQPEETAQFLMQRTDWIHLAGNHERQTLTLARERQGETDRFTADALSESSRRWLDSLPGKPTEFLWRQGGRMPKLPSDVAICHGSPRSDLEYLMETAEGEVVRQATPDELTSRLGQHVSSDIQLLACGHTHVPRTWDVSESLRLLNPGSVGLPAYDDDAPMPLSRYHRVENGSPDARYAIASQAATGHWQAELLAVPYDHEAMAILAERNGRADWAHALRTGFMPR
ncbi:metallophosphoesterase family protein [Hydrogenophaga sp. 5NK40-0174]|uniref:metallophosphoesterase family protein n=1 Tax=Hydrogenophaga sp. 5NK40-0174 TaxID=3127649 RepID=UPI003108583C